MNNNDKSQFFSTREETIKWLDKYKIENYTINDDLSVDVNGHVDISYNGLRIIPIKFGNVTGCFWCDSNKLIGLAGSPETVGGNFDCGNNRLTSLAGVPKTVNGVFSCNNNKLTGISGSPRIVDGRFDCRNNRLISLLEVSGCNFKENIFLILTKTIFNKKN